MLYPVKIEFMQWPSGSWEDWSALLHEPPVISKKVESENEGEAGLIVFDDCNAAFRNEPGSVVDDAFGDETNLTAAQRYMYRISNVRKGLYAEPFEIVTHLGDQLVTDTGDIVGSNYAGLQESKLFEGMADFSTLEWPEMGRLIAFNVLDKLSALDILQSKPVRTLHTIKNSTTDHLPWITPLNYALGDYYTIYIGVSPSVIIEVIKYEHPLFNPVHVDVGSTVPVLNAGMILVREESAETKYLFTKSQYYFEGNYPGENDTWIEPTSDSDDISGGYRIDSSDADAYLVSDPTIKLKFYKDQFYASNICNTSYVYDSGDGNWKTIVTSFKGEKCLTQLVAQAWGTIYPLFKGLTTFNIPYEYWRQTIDENPFNKTPLEALKMLANTMKVYVYFNKESILVIQKRDESTLGSSGTTRTIGTTKVIEKFTRKYFWNKIVDGVSMQVKSWLTDGGGDPLIGTSEVSKQIESGVYIKPKNPITVEILTSDASDNTQELLDARALTEATAYLNFYGKRRSSYEGVLDLDKNTEAWDLVDNIEMNDVATFFTSVDIDSVEKTVSLEAVEVVGHDYDRRQIVITPAGN